MIFDKLDLILISLLKSREMLFQGLNFLNIRLNDLILLLAQRFLIITLILECEDSLFIIDMCLFLINQLLSQSQNFLFQIGDFIQSFRILILSLNQKFLIDFDRLRLRSLTFVHLILAGAYLSFFHEFINSLRAA